MEIQLEQVLKLGIHPALIVLNGNGGVSRAGLFSIVFQRIQQKKEAYLTVRDYLALEPIFWT